MDEFTLEVTDPDGNGSVVKVEVEVVYKGVLGCGCETGSGIRGWAWIGLAAPLVLLHRRRHLPGTT